ncbi:MAG: hypothetical protein ACOCUU_03580 [Nanoarchaeota archaeon]
MNGKKSSYGLLRKYGGKIVALGIFEIKAEYEEIFLERMKKITSD